MHREWVGNPRDTSTQFKPTALFFAVAAACASPHLGLVPKFSSGMSGGGRATAQIQHVTVGPFQGVQKASLPGWDYHCPILRRAGSTVHLLNVGEEFGAVRPSQQLAQRTPLLVGIQSLVVKAKAAVVGGRVLGKLGKNDVEHGGVQLHGCGRTGIVMAFCGGGLDHIERVPVNVHVAALDAGVATHVVKQVKPRVLE